jgi:hypothetical protein
MSSYTVDDDVTNSVYVSARFLWIQMCFIVYDIRTNGCRRNASVMDEAVDDRAFSIYKSFGKLAAVPFAIQRVHISIGVLELVEHLKDAWWTKAPKAKNIVVMRTVRCFAVSIGMFLAADVYVHL